ncbi:MAG: tRNA uridine-5-carboxymethylaminomethyl(34) synthesis GTPase MnmE [Epsilonproteobacteria bacterium]|nr:tRNA uridine-5-carboxymethylaminomethyl(34) synthesis GTPase MnmE [Campylobacterota bacterium]NPA56121.1 tRNA uridine-5-carboxymethylaminomethyl(34) synthesis GTPase MnmE [Campylobacterota bacterium]
MSSENRTIAAIATAHGIGSIAIVRMSGAAALEIAERLTGRSFHPRQATLTPIYDREGELIDQGIVIYFQAPRSFTGEDIVEFQVHGGVVVAQRILQELLVAGARLAEPGEFTKRAFLHGKIDLTQAEAVAKLIEAKSEDAGRILARQMKGELREFVEEVRERLIRILAYVEVNIDYAEEDLPETLEEEMGRQLAELAQRLRRVVELSERRRGLIEGFRIAIIGRPNTGKSSLLNKMVAYERAIVSDVAGTTRDTIEEEIRIGSHLVRIIDTAGIREAKDQIEQVGIERSLKAVEESDLVLALFDGSTPLTPEDREIIGLLKEKGKESIAVINKIDLGIRLEREELEGLDLVEISVQEDITPLIERIEERLDRYGGREEVILISTRQIEGVREALEEIEASFSPLEEGELEIFAFHLNRAIDLIGSISRPMATSELLDKMFGEFCLGK